MKSGQSLVTRYNTLSQTQEREINLKRRYLTELWDYLLDIGFCPDSDWLEKIELTVQSMNGSWPRHAVSSHLLEGFGAP